MFVLSLIILVASFSMSSTLSLITIKKIKDIGILRLLGMKLGDIRKIIIYQTLIIGLKGLLWGMVCGLGLVTFQNIYNIISLPSDIYAMETLPMILTLKDIGMVVFINVFIIMISGISGGKKFLNHDPLELLKWVK
jgi:ABC-type lipoprotein release transport system permease subunit